MGIETALIIAATVAAGSQIAGGFAANKAAKSEANLQQDQARLAQTEAMEEADRVAGERRKQLNATKLAFLKSGVTLEGSPLLVLEDDKNYYQKEVDAIVRRGNAEYNLGMSSAQITRNKGRSAILQGFGGAAGTVASVGGSMYSAGMLKAPAKAPVKVK